LKNEKSLLLKLHPCSNGLTEDAINEIAAATDLMNCAPGDWIQKANEPVTSIFLVVHGRLRLTMKDMHGKVLINRFEYPDGQFGGLAAALGEPAGIDCVAEDPSTLLRFNYDEALELTKKHEVFRLNLMKLLANGVKHTIYQHKQAVRPSTVAIFHENESTRSISRTLMTRLTELGEEICLVNDRENWQPIEGVQHHCVVENGRFFDRERIQHLMQEWSRFPRMLVDVETSLDVMRAINLLRACDLVLWCVTPANWQASVEKLVAIEADAPTWRDKVCVVWLLENEKYAPSANELRELANRDIKVSFLQPAENRGDVLNLGTERIIHMLRGIKIGVALGGGAARGMANLGVLKALEQNGIVVDMIAGTSAGAMTGTVYASGMEVDYSVDRFVHDLRPSWIFRRMPRGDQWYLLYKYRTGQFDPMLRKYLAQSRLEQLPVPMNTVTVDLIGGKAIVRDAGDAVHAIIESINVPVLSRPIFRHGQALVDGGIIDNVPADVLISKGCNFVIAASVTAKMEIEFAGNRPDTPPAKMKRASTIQTALRVFAVQNSSINSYGVQPADFVIEPDVTKFELTEFTKTDELAAVGEQTAQQSISQIKSLLSAMDRQLFADPDAKPG
jgi:predicted acylesterase/phospholipase RssA/CRP-like cAMP-binding protein